jgi:hypothetical protein
LVEGGCGTSGAVGRGISRGCAEGGSVGMRGEDGIGGSGCSNCNEWRELVAAALEELGRGRLDLARERLEAAVTCKGV